jgi:hypothetical protein
MFGIYNIPPGWFEIDNIPPFELKTFEPIVEEL